jgi:hypothetical protein
LYFMHAETRFNCEEFWGRLGNKIEAPLDYRERALQSRTSPVLLAEDRFASAQEKHRAAA